MDRISRTPIIAQFRIRHGWLPALTVLLWLAAAAASLPAAAAQPAGPVTLTLDRAVYTIYDDFTVCWGVPGLGRITLSDIYPDGSVHPVHTVEQGTSDCRPGVMSPPVGPQCMRVEWSGAGQRGSAQACYDLLPGDPPAASAVPELIGQHAFELCFSKGTATFSGTVLDATAVQYSGVTYAYVLVELFNRGPHPAPSVLAVVLFDDRFRGDRMQHIPDEPEYLARARSAGALTAFDAVPLRQSVRVLYVFTVPPGAQVLALSPHPICYIG